MPNSKLATNEPESRRTCPRHLDESIGNRACSVDKKAAKIGIAALADP